MGITMRKTRLSLWYLTTYLLLGGIGLLVDPDMALKLLFAEGDYGTAMPRLAGMLMIGLGVFVLQIIRHELSVLYPTTLAVRGFFLVSMFAVYLSTSDPLFFALICIVGLGVLLTGISYLSERK